MKTTSERVSASQDALSLRELLGFIYRQKALLIGCLVLGVIGWAVSVALTPAEYRVYSSFTIDAAQGTNTSADDIRPYTFGDKVGDILTAIQVMQGEDVLGQAYRDANVSVDRLAGGYMNGPRVSITQAGYTNLIEVTADGPNTEQLSTIARDIPTLFARVARRGRDQSLDRAETALQSRQKEAAAAVRSSLAAVAKFNVDLAAKAGTNDLGEIITRRASAISNAEAAKADLQGAEERLVSLRAARAALPPTIKNPTVTGSTARRIQLADQINGLRADRAQLAVTLADRSPEIRAIDAKLAILAGALRAIPASDQTLLVNRNPQLDIYDDKVAEADAGVKGAQARLDRANEFLKGVEGKALVITNGQGEKNRLEGVVVERQKVLDLVSTRLQDLEVRRNAVADPVQVVVPPSVQPTPIKPRPTLYLAIALALSGIFGIALAALKEHIDDRITTPEFAARETGAPVLGVMPPLRGRERLTLIDPRTPRRIADAARLIHQRIETIYGISSNGDLRSLMLTSMLRTEERSSVTRHLAASFASEGKSVILVSVGNTSLLETLGGYTSKVGYAELLADSSRTEEALVPTDLPNVRAITRGSAVAPLTTAHIALVHQRLAQLADIVLYDGPSYLFPFDVQSLGNVVDATVIVVRPGVPKRNLLGAASDSLRGLHSHFLGIAITGSSAEEVAKDVVRYDGEAAP